MIRKEKKLKERKKEEDNEQRKEREIQVRYVTLPAAGQTSRCDERRETDDMKNFRCSLQNPISSSPSLATHGYRPHTADNPSSHNYNEVH